MFGVPYEIGERATENNRTQSVDDQRRGFDIATLPAGSLSSAVASLVKPTTASRMYTPRTARPKDTLLAKDSSERDIRSADDWPDL